MKTWINELVNVHKNDLENRFAESIKFGTGGLRGKLGVGKNRINQYTVRQATQAVCEVIGSGSVCIAYDTRMLSKELAEETARVFLGNDFVTYLFEEPTPTPVLSYAVRELGCDVGIVITASHNPKEYNGYKVYNNRGIQITVGMAEKIQNAMADVDCFGGIPLGNSEDVRLIEDTLVSSYI